MQRARALLRCDQGEGGPGWTDAEIIAAYGGTERGLYNWRRQAVDRGPLSQLERKARATPPRAPKLDGEANIRLTSLVCSTPPNGRVRWTMQLLADRLAELKIVDSISEETVRRALKKTKSSRGKR